MHHVRNDDRTFSLSVDPRAYRLNALKKAAYRLAARFTLVIDEASQESLAVTLQFRSPVSDEVAADNVRVLYEELLDQELREEIAEETKPLRTLIIAQAFSRVDLIKRDE